jgi:bacterioferritin-associated ferredoxin
MIVCHCVRVTETAIDAAIAAGAATVTDVAGRCRAGSRCGSCHRSIEALLAASPYEAANPAQSAA